MARAVLIGGGNIGDVKSNLFQARNMLEEKGGRIVAQSSVWESKPWGEVKDEIKGTDPSKFFNQVFVIETELSPHELLYQIHFIETALGRQASRSRNNKASEENKNRIYLSRTMDIDILFYDEQIIDSEDLVIPHPLINEREFVLNPLSEVIPDYVHPITGEKISDILLKLKK